jgi:putative peptidoglycan lipid II flippase
MVGKIWNGESKTITSAALLLGGAALASKALGVFRDRVLAGAFGAGDTLDAYYAAFRLPDMIYGLLILGALSAGFIPVFTEYLLRREASPVPRYGDGEQHDAWRLVNELVGILGAILAVTTGAMIIFAPWIVPAITPGFHGDKLALTVHLSQIMFFSTMLLGLSAVMGGVLQGTKRFFAFAIAPIFYNLGIIIGVIFFARWWGPLGLAAGVVLGAALHLASQYLPVCGLGFKLKPRLKTVDEGVKNIAKLSGPRILSLAVTQVDLTVATVIASTLASGSVSVMNFANNLQSVPYSFIGISYAVAAYPTLARFAVKKDKEQFIDNVNGVTRQILFFVVPVAIILLLLRAQVVRIILGTGNFNWTATVATADTLALFAISIAFQAVSPLLIRAFYALKDSTTPLLIGMVTVATSIIGNLIFSKTLGVPGLALAFSIASILQVVLLWVTLRAKLGTLNETVLVRSLVKLTIAALPMALAIQLAKNLLGTRVDMDTVVGVFIQLVVSALVGLGIYFGAAYLLKSEEAKSFVIAFKRRIGARELPAIAADEAVE